jgi:hypothetical protein
LPISDCSENEEPGGVRSCTHVSSLGVWHCGVVASRGELWQRWRATPGVDRLSLVLTTFLAVLLPAVLLRTPSEISVAGVVAMVGFAVLAVYRWRTWAQPRPEER